ncbi:B3 domain-containing protein [Panicum miliaceum]|uniref:B3 domain-containing protein n=1 Tax=Panicum miliaceum TaxID=4540 RepID=A0A3L6SWD3_PANMI|nr:B3 domain-containing protein [Panicum miliaceum]
MASQDHEVHGMSVHEMSGNSCKRCSHCDSHYYWHHLDDRQKHFFKLMLGDFQQKMIVPEKFANNFRGQISGVVKPEAPDGNLYSVSVSQDLNKLVFSGDSHFKVLIFDPSGCEKEFFRVVMNPSRGVRQRGIPHEQSPSGEGLARHRTAELSHSRKASKMTPADSPSQRSTEEMAYPEETVNPMDSGLFQTSSGSRTILAKGCILSSAQKAKLDAFQKKIRPGIPLYVTNMNKTNLSNGYMVICKDYSDKYLPHEDQTITLCHLGSKKRDANLKISADGAYIFSTELGPTPPLQLAVHPGYVVNKHTNLTPEQKKKVLEKLREIQAKTLVFVTAKKRGNESMCFNKDFAMEHLPRVPRRVRLRRPGVSCSWEVELQVRNEGKMHQLCRGWKQFVDDNALRQGDLCLFQPLGGGGGEDDGELAMNVHILREH